MSDGKLSESLSIPYTGEYIYVTDFNYQASKDGYYPKSGRIDKMENYNEVILVKEEAITLIRPTDYFNRDFASTISDGKLKKKILDFIASQIKPATE